MSTSKHFFMHKCIHRTLEYSRVLTKDSFYSLVLQEHLYIIPRLHNEFLITLSCNYNYQHILNGANFIAEKRRVHQQTDLENLYTLRERRAKRHKSNVRGNVSRINRNVSVLRESYTALPTLERGRESDAIN